MREALRNNLEKQSDLKVIAEANDGEEVIELTTELLPDVVIMDIHMPKVNGLEAIQKIKERCPDIPVLVLTVLTDKEYVLRILEAGADGYLTKAVFGNEIINAVRGVVAGEASRIQPGLASVNQTRHQIQ